jgi:hypothetical protein
MSQLIKNGETTVGALLDPGPTGTILFPGDPGWDESRTPWVGNVDQQPAAGLRSYGRSLTCQLSSPVLPAPD